jgi:hypothetical protein
MTRANLTYYFLYNFSLSQVLSIPQIYRIGTMFWDDKYGTQGLSPEAIPYTSSAYAHFFYAFEFI